MLTVRMIRSDVWYPTGQSTREHSIKIGGYSLQVFSCFLLGNSGITPIPLSEGPIASFLNVGESDRAAN